MNHDFGPAIADYPFFFWYVLAAAFPVLGFLVDSPVHRWKIRAVTNVVYLIILLGPWALFPLVFGSTLWIGLRTLEKGRDGMIPRLRLAGVSILWVWAAITVVLFWVHQNYSFDLPPMKRQIVVVLLGMGFLYTLLRAADAIISVVYRNSRLLGPMDFLNYLYPFHMLAVAQEYEDFAKTLDATPPRLTVRAFVTGLSRLAFGFAAFNIFSPWIVAAMLLDWPSATWGGFLIQLQIIPWNLYFQLSGLCHMAVGAGILLRIETPENFDWPLFARNMNEFWNKWHMRVGSFIRRNLFTPLMVRLLAITDGRAIVSCMFLSYGISFGLCGIWHELNIRWLVWGLWHALGLGICKTFDMALLAAAGRNGYEACMRSRAWGVAAWFLTYEFVAVSVRIISP